MSAPETHEEVDRGTGVANEQPRAALTIVSILLTVVVGVLYLMYRDGGNGSTTSSLSMNGPIYFAGDESGPYPGDASVYVVDPDGTGFKLVASSKRVPSIGSFAVSPDGRFIAYATGGFDSVGDIYVAPVDGGSPLRLTADPPGVGRMGGHADYRPAWSPDGRRIVFMSSRCCDTPNGFSTFGLYIIRPDGSDLHELDAVRSAPDPVWSPDGKLIAYSVANRAVWVIGADGSDARRLTEGTRFIKNLAWSPNGDQIAFISQGPDPEGPTPGAIPQDFQVRVIGKDGSGERMVYTCKDLCRFGGYAVDWSPDGKEIAFIFGRVRGHGIVWHIGMVAPDGTGFRVLDTHGIQVHDFSWSAARRP